MLYIINHLHTNNYIATMKTILIFLIIISIKLTQSCIPCECYIGVMDCTNVKSISSLRSLCTTMTLIERFDIKIMILLNSSITNIEYASCFPFLMDIDMRDVHCPITMSDHSHQRILSNCIVCISHIVI